MAATQNNKKKKTSSTAGGKRSSTTAKKKNGNSKNGGSRSAVPQKRPIRREIGGVVFLVLALFAGVGYFKTDAIFITFFVHLLKGLFGYGFWLIPPAFLLTGLILLIHRGRPVRLRTACMLLSPVVIGGVLHILLCQQALVVDVATMKILYDLGISMKSGGLICGALGFGGEKLFGAFASIVVGVVLAAVLLLVGLKINPADVYERSRSRRVEYEPEPEIERPAAEARPVGKETARRPRAQIDIPLDHEPDSVLAVRQVEAAKAKEAMIKKPSFFNRNSSVLKPHELWKRTPKQTEPTPAVPEPESVPTPAPVQEPTYAPIPTPVNAAPTVTLKPKSVAAAAAPVMPVAPMAPEPARTQEPMWEAADEVMAESTPTAEEKKSAEAPKSAAAGEEQPSKKQVAAEVAAATAEVAAEIENKAVQEEKVYEYPPYDLLNGEHGGDVALAEAEQQQTLQRLCDTLESFGIRAHAGEVVRGPSVTQYEFQLEQGVKLSKVTSLSDDLALSLGVSNIRIAPIPEKNSVIGIEVPNKHSSMVLIRDVLEGDTFRNHKSKVAFSVGRDIAGHDIVGNISKLPHVLIAGTTGSGKSVCINSLIISLLYKATPDEVRFIMVDPKMVELNPYNGIPHLLIPVVTDPKKAAGALQWAVFEMMKRYKAFSEHNVKDLSSFNKLAKQDDSMQTMPTVVVVIDELADLMMVAAKEVEESICRVAQMGRAAGVHLVIATQRPSADIITGIMKANIPSRIAFAVASSMESRIILDMTGAEKLMGKGDMLYFPVAAGKPRRVQGCMITEEEIDRVVAYVKQSGEAQYSDEVMQKIEETLTDSKDGGKSAAAEAVADETDPLFDDGVEVLLETGQASVSMLQRRLKLGYSRAARLIDQMEERGIVGPFEGSKPRQLLVSRASWEAYKNGGVSVEEEDDEDEEEPREIDIPIPDLPEAEREEAAPWDEEDPDEDLKIP